MEIINRIMHDLNRFAYKKKINGNIKKKFLILLIHEILIKYQ